MIIKKPFGYSDIEMISYLQLLESVQKNFIEGKYICRIKKSKESRENKEKTCGGFSEDEQIILANIQDSIIHYTNK